MFRNVVRCISLVRVEEVQEELLAYAGSSFLRLRGNFYVPGCVFVASSLRL